MAMLINLPIIRKDYENNEKKQWKYGNMDASDPPFPFSKVDAKTS